MERSDSCLDYDNVKDLVYLEAAILENLRMYPPFSRCAHECICNCVVCTF